MLKTPNIFIVIILIAVLFMAVGYSLFASDLELTGNAEITGNWNVLITDIEATDYSPNANPGTPTATATTANFAATLNAPSDYVTYRITIKNLGTIDAVLHTFNLTSDEYGTDAIKILNTEPAQELKAGESTKFEITVLYDPFTTSNPIITTKNITGTIQYAQE